MPLPECALGGLAHGGKCRDQNVVERPAVCDLLLEFGGAGLQRLVGQCGDFRLERIDGVDAGLVALHPPVVGGAEKFAGERADHAEFLSSRFMRCSRDVVHQVAYQLTVTRRGKIPELGDHPPMSENKAIQCLTATNEEKYADM